MALTNAERQKRWRENNRVIYNLRRRNARKKNITIDVPQGEGNGIPSEITVRPVSQHTVESLRKMIRPENLDPAEATIPVVKPKVFLNDHGAVISEKGWERLQERKREAEEKGYEFDPE